MPRIVATKSGKVHIHITVGQDFLEWMDSEVDSGRFASRSHAIEVALRHASRHIDNGEDVY